MISDAPLVFIQACTSARVRARLGGRQDHALAALEIGRGDGGRDMVGPQAGDEILDRSERYRFAGDLGEALGAPLDGDKALAVDRDDIARSYKPPGSVAGVVRQERVCAQQEGRLRRGDGFRDLAIVHGSRIEVDLHRTHEAKQQSAGQAEGMEHRQRKQMSVSLISKRVPI